MANAELDKSKLYVTVDVIEYIPDSVIIKMIQKKTSGSISLRSFDCGEEPTEKATPFDTHIQIVEGNAEIIINGSSQQLKIGQSMTIPAHKANSIQADGRFKMIMTINKNGYEQVI
jgi:quercetin dioxygenase-like cupin family protein